MQRWRAAPSAGSLVGILALLLCVAATAGVVMRRIPAAGDRWLALLGWWLLVAGLGIVIVVLAILLWGYFTLSYALDEAGDDGGALIVRWAWQATRIPLAEIEYFGPARQLLAATVGPPWPWPGYYLRTVYDESLGPVQLLATQPLRRQLLVCSARGSFGISPDRPARLLERYHVARGATTSSLAALLADLPAGVVADLEDEEERAYPALAGNGQRAFRERTTGDALALLRDRPAVSLVLLGGALIAAMLWFILLRYDTVPQALPLHYSATGQPDRIGTPREIFLLPLITALVAVANITLAWSVIRFDRFAARLLLSGTCLVQLVAWGALLKLI